MSEARAYPAACRMIVSSAIIVADRIRKYSKYIKVWITDPLDWKMVICASFNLRSETGQIRYDKIR